MGLIKVNNPDRKVTLGALGGAIITVTVLVLNQYVVPDNPITAEIALAAQTVMIGLLQYLVPNPEVN